MLYQGAYGNVEMGSHGIVNEAGLFASIGFCRSGIGGAVQPDNVRSPQLKGTPLDFLHHFALGKIGGKVSGVGRFGNPAQHATFRHQRFLRFRQTGGGIR
jgi:hypothetical protein